MTYDDLLIKWKSLDITCEFLRANFLLRYIYNSNRIEGLTLTYHQTKDVFESEYIRDYGGDVRELFSVLNSQNTFDFICSEFRRNRAISLDFVKELHKVSMRNSLDKVQYFELSERAGEFKKHDYVVGRHDAGVSPEDVESSLSELINMILANEHKNTLEVATILHCEFECIHPFSDGNGRVGRWLMNYWLLCHGYPPIIIYEEDKGRYYDILEEYDVSQDPTKMFNFLKEQSIKTWQSNTN